MEAVDSGGNILSEGTVDRPAAGNAVGVLGWFSHPFNGISGLFPVRFVDVDGTAVTFTAILFDHLNAEIEEASVSTHFVNAAYQVGLVNLLNASNTTMLDILAAVQHTFPTT